MALDAFLKLDGIDGDSLDDKHKNEIKLGSFSWGVSNPTSVRGAAPGSGTGKAQFQDVHCTKEVDKSSAPLSLACASGRHIATGELVLRSAGENPVEYFKLSMKEIFVTSYNITAHDAGLRAQESFSLSYSWYQYTYKTQTEKGGAGPQVQSGWDLGKNAKV